MALKDLRSDLSWYGTKSPGPYTPNLDTADTKFKGVENVPYVETSGYEFRGVAKLAPISRFAGDSFVVDNVSYSDRGAASRKAQLGTGTLFDVGNHEFDIVRTGFHSRNKYDESYGITHGNAGLANTYTIDSPIDDMYNKFNLRQDAHDPYGYAKPPFILRGIQQDGKSDPQRWGTPGVFDIPRGGIVTSVERAALDAVRIGKFLVRPPGISFLVKQVGLQLTNPNVEGVDPSLPGSFATKLYDPISSITNAVGGTLGLRTDRHFPPLVRGPLSTYEGVLNARAALGDAVATNKNRLVVLRNELLTGTSTGASGGLLEFFQSLSNKVSGFKGQTMQTVSGLTGPGSLLGIGSTTIRRSSHATPDLIESDNAAARKDVVNKDTGKTSSELNIDYKTGENYKDERKHGQLDGKSFVDKLVAFNGGGTEESNGTALIHKYKTMGYGQIPKRDNKTNILDFRALKNDSEGDDALYSNDRSKNVLYGSSKSTLETKYGYTSYPAGNVNDPNFKGITDKINSIDFVEFDGANADYSPEGAEDFIKFKFAPLLGATNIADAKDYIIFRAYLDSLSDSFQPEWTPTNDQGRADPKIQYAGFGRSVQLSFKVAIFSVNEIQAVWNKLNALASLTYPRYVSSGFSGVHVKVTIGDLFVNQPMYVQSLDLSWDNETPWELTNGYQVPFYTTVDMGLGWLGSQRPEYNVTKAYDTNANNLPQSANSGLEPQNNLS